MNKLILGPSAFISGLAAIEICEIKMKHIYFHISSRKTLVPFALYNLGFIVFFSHSCSFFLSFILCLVAFFLSLCFFAWQNTSYSSFFTTRNTKAKIFQCRSLRLLSLLISRNKIKTVWECYEYG